MAARGAWTPDKVRQRIQTSMLLNRLHDHILGTIEISATQLKSIEILLRKSLPDLSAIAHTGDIGVRKADELSDSELAAIAAGSGSGVIEAQELPQEPSNLH